MRVFKFCLLFVLFLPFVASAEDTFYVGAKSGYMVIDDIAIASTTNATNGGLLIGYQFESGGYGNIALEGEFTQVISKGDITINGNTGYWEVETAAIYLAYRTPDTLYFKAKAGMLREDVYISVAGATADGTDTGSSYGFGVGLRAANVMLELEYTLVEVDINYISLGLVFHF
ncbi:MAG: porin family protein [Desulfobacterales bacterium]|nr:porin family protein [Desulfobacterales bacterium]